MATLCNIVMLNNCVPEMKLIRARTELYNDFELKEVSKPRTFDRTFSVGIKDTAISIDTTAATGISQDLLREEPNQFDGPEASLKLAKLLKFCIDKSVYICTWNMDEVFWYVIEAQLTEPFKILGSDINTLITYPKRISLYHLAADLFDNMADRISARMLVYSIINDEKKYVEEFITPRRGLKYFEVDCKSNILILEALMAKLNVKTLREVVDYIRTPRIISTLNFGKYDGCLIKDVYMKDFRYLKWLQNSPRILRDRPSLKLTLDNLFDVEK